MDPLISSPDLTNKKSVAMVNSRSSSSSHKDTDGDPILLSPPSSSQASSLQVSGTVPIKSKLSEGLSILRNKTPGLTVVTSDSANESHSKMSSLESEMISSTDSTSNTIPLPKSPTTNSDTSSLALLIGKRNSNIDALSDPNSNNSSDSNSERGKLMNLISRGVRRLSRSNSDETEIKIPIPKRSTIDSSDQDEEDYTKPLDKTTIPAQIIEHGIEMLRITHKKKIKRLFKLNLDSNILFWNSKSSSFIEIEKIRNIRSGNDAKNYREEFKISSDYKDLWITIIYNNESKYNSIKALHVIATNKHDYDIFLSTMKNLVFFKRQLNRSLSGTTDSDLFTKLHWNNKASNNERLPFEGVLKLTSKLHIHINPDYIRSLFNVVDNTMKGYLDFEEFKKFVKLLRDRKEFIQIFSSLKTKEEGRMEFDEFKRFLIEVQHEVIQEDGAFERIFEKFSKSKNYLNLEDFGSFLISSYTSPLKEIEEDYSKPLNEYFISSSHNTYLMGRQVKGSSSVEGYIKALQRGCRCIEIDVWDGDRGPIVTHGRTFSSSVDFQTVIETVRKYSFITSPYPVIISLEIRCSLENQVKVAEILKDVLQDLLLTKSIFSNAMSLPSPGELKHKILIKVKKSSSTTMSASNGSITESGSTTASNSSSFSENDLNPSKAHGSSSSINKIITRKSKTVKISPGLSALAVYLVGVKFRNFSLPESKTFNHCFSFSERTLLKMIKDEAKFTSFLKHNRRFLMRVYPSIYRFNSSNFKPLLYWELGCQMVATNWQIYDLGQQINESMFNIGTNSGYVLKPVNQRIEKTKFKKQHFKNVLKFDNMNYLHIEIISAQQLPKPKDSKFDIFDPYVELEVYSGKASSVSVGSRRTGSYKICMSSSTTSSPSSSSSSSEEEDENDNEPRSVGHSNKFRSNDAYSLDSPSVIFKTNTVPQNGFNPIWSQKCSMNFCSNENKLVFLRFLLRCNNSDNTENNLIGVYCCRLDYLKKGYRHLPIFDLQGEEYIFSTLFVKVDYGPLLFTN